MSWLGRIGYCLPRQKIPIGLDGQPMQPLVMIFLDGLEYVSAALEGVKMVSIFWTPDLLFDLEYIEYTDQIIKVYEYDDLDALVECDWGNHLLNQTEWSYDSLKPISLKFAGTFDDYPDVSNPEIPDDIMTEIEKYDYDDISDDWNDPPEESENHKIGGWPKYKQWGNKALDGFKYVILIASDNNANLYIDDMGAIYFFRNPETKQWIESWDCY